MRERGLGCLVEADRQRGEDRFAVVGGVHAGQRFVHMLEAGARRRDMAGHQCMMGAIVGQTLERGHAMLGGHRPDRFHLGADIDRLQTSDAILNLANALADPGADDIERIEASHQ